MKFAANTFLSMASVVNGDGRVRQDFPSRDAMANLINMAMDFGEVLDTQEDENGRIITTEVEIDPELRERFLKEYDIITSGRSNIGCLGYVLGLHSAVFVPMDRSSNLIETATGYSGVVEGGNIRTGTYMYVSLNKSVVDNMQEPFFFEDYIYLRQLEREGKVAAPWHIPQEAFEELFKSLGDLMDTPTIFLSKSTTRMLARRYAGIALGLMVRWGYVDDVSTMASTATEMALDDKIRKEIFKSFVEALELARTLGDVEG